MLFICVYSCTCSYVCVFIPGLLIQIKDSYSFAWIRIPGFFSSGPDSIFFRGIGEAKVFISAGIKKRGGGEKTWSKTCFGVCPLWKLFSSGAEKTILNFIMGICSSLSPTIHLFLWHLLDIIRHTFILTYLLDRFLTGVVRF